MSTILSIRELDKKGLSIAEIARREGVSEPTVRKYVTMEDFSPERPLRRAQKPSILDPYKPIIDSYLMADRKVRRKQRHSAKRAYDRLVEEENYTGGYTTVCMYVKKRRAEIMDPRTASWTCSGSPARPRQTSARSTWRSTASRPPCSTWW